MSSDICEKILRAAQNGNESTLSDLLLNDRIASNELNWAKHVNKNVDNILHVAARKKRLNIMRLMFESWNARLVINVGNKTGKTPLHEAAQVGCVDVARYLLNQGAEVDALTSNGWTPMMLGASKGGIESLELVELLIQYNANPSVQNKDGWTALHIACRKGDVEIVKFYCDRYPHLVNVKSKNGRYPIHTAALHGHHQVVCLLLDTSNATVSVSDYCGSTPIHEAARSNHCDVMKELIKSGASVWETDALGLNCLHMAAQTGAIDVVRFLITEWKVNANVSNTSNGLTPLHYAAQAGQSKTVTELLSHNADPLKKDSQGRLPWEVSHGEARQQFLEIIGTESKINME